MPVGLINDLHVASGSLCVCRRKKKREGETIMLNRRFTCSSGIVLRVFEESEQMSEQAVLGSVG